MNRAAKKRYIGELKKFRWYVALGGANFIGQVGLTTEGKVVVEYSINGIPASAGLELKMETVVIDDLITLINQP